MTVGPAIVLAVAVALVHVSLYVLIRGRTGARLPLLLVAAFLGAWAGDAAAGRAGVDPVRIGDFHVLAASAVAWLGIAVVALLGILGPDRVSLASPGRATAGRTTLGLQPEASGQESGPGSTAGRPGSAAGRTGGAGSSVR